MSSSRCSIYAPTSDFFHFQFMEQSLSAGNNMEFFIEGSRSRSGKPNSPKAGLLSVLVDSVQEGEGKPYWPYMVD